MAYHRPEMKLDSVIDSGKINFDILDALIENTLKKVLQVKLEDTPVLLTESAIHNKDLRMRLCEHMFDVHNVPALFMVKLNVLAPFLSYCRSTDVLPQE